MPLRLATTFNKNTRRAFVKLNRLSFVLLFLLMTNNVLFAQFGIEKNLNQNRSLLKKLDRQIEELRQKILATKRKEADLELQIQLLDQEMALIMRSKGVLEQEIDLVQKKISQKQQELNEAEKRLEQLKQLYTERVFYSYKYGRVKNIELLISARSINQALVRIKYLQQIARHDANLIKIIENKRQQIAAIKRTLQSNLQQKNLALREIQKKTNQYLARKAEKQNLLRKLKSTHYSYQKQLTEKDRQRKQLLDLIAALEKERLAKAKQTVPAKSTEISFNFENFRKAKGKLPWPVKGKVITRYGKQRDPVSKTYIKNTDIEIKARPGTPVKCIFPGVVRIITFLPGYGNTVIVDHGKGFYSIYSHLAQIYVYKNATVRQNQIIGKVGDSGYLGPVSLRFGIYGSKKTYNPLSWLE